MAEADQFSCGICREMFNSFMAFMEHKTIHEELHKNKNGSVCLICSSSFPDLTSLKLHLHQCHSVFIRIGQQNSDIETSNQTEHISNTQVCIDDSVKTCLKEPPETDDCRERRTRLESMSSNETFSQSLISGSPSLKDITSQTESIGVLDLEDSQSNPLDLSFDHRQGLSMTTIFAENTKEHAQPCSLLNTQYMSELDESTNQPNNTEGIFPIILENEKNMFPVNCPQKKEDLTLLSANTNAPLMNKDVIKSVNNENDNSLASFIKNESLRIKKIKEKDSHIGLKKDYISIDTHFDFHFLLGTTRIKGNSMCYDRIDFKCFHCGFCTAWRPSLIKHMKYAHSETLKIHKIVDIKKVKRRFQTDDVFAKNYQVIRMSEYLSRHMKNKLSKRRVRKIERQDIPGKYHCPICHKVFTRLRYIRRHQSSHAIERHHLCDMCGKSFKTKTTLIAHRRSHKTKSYQCPQCPFVSNISAAIHSHRQVHPNGSVVCDICGAAYIDKSTLKKHKLVHTDPGRQYPCTHPGCTWRFKNDAMRLAHVRAHTTEGKFPCPHCGYHFRQKHHLQRHIVKIHPNTNPDIKTLSDIPASGIPSKVTPVGDDCHQLGSSIMKLQLPLEQGVDLKTIGAKTNKSDIKVDVNTQNISSLNNIQIISSTQGALLNLANKNHLAQKLLETDQTMIEVLVSEKNGCLTLLEQEEEQTSANTLEVASSSLNNLEYITDTGDIVQLLRAGQTYMGRDEHGNLVQYRIADTEYPCESVPQPIYFLGVDGSVVATGGNQEQALVIASKT